MGFSLIALQVMPTVNKRVNDAYSNYMNYWDSTQAHNLAVSAANMGANIIFENPTSPSTWEAGIPSTSFAGGTLKATMAYMTGADSAKIKIIASGLFLGVPDSVFVILEPGSFARFAYFSNVEGGINWVTQDTIWGPLHTQDVMTINGTPTFWGKVSALKGTSPAKSSAKFYGGYASGVNIPLPGDLNGVTSAATSGGKMFTGMTDVWLTFQNDSVKYKTSKTGAWTITPFRTLAPNGVIGISNGNLHVQGTFKGQGTIVANGSGNGNVYIDDNVLYKTDPSVTPSSTDLLGICAYNSIIVSDSTANHTNCTIDAAMFCLKQGLTAQDYSSLPICGNLTIMGGIQQYQRGAVGTVSGGVINHGFQKNYNYDNRLMTAFPPYYPATGTYQIISWLE